MAASCCTEASGNMDYTVKTGASVELLLLEVLPLSGGLND